MHAAYDKLEKDLKIGPFEMKDGVKRAKPHAEYPKMVTTAGDKRVVVQNLTEEIAAAGDMELAIKPSDPLNVEKAALMAERVKLQEQNAEAVELNKKMKESLKEVEAMRSGNTKSESEPNAVELGAMARAAGIASPLVNVSAPATPNDQLTTAKAGLKF